MTLIDAAKQALEALEKIDGAMPFPVGRSAITALRTAIEQAEKQDGWVLREVLFDDGEPIAHREPAPVPVPWSQALESVWAEDDTTQPAAQRQPLTDEEIDDIWNRYCDEMGEASINDAYDIARAIEAAHGIKEKNHG
jgi:hypothetical protein